MFFRNCCALACLIAVQSSWGRDPFCDALPGGLQHPPPGQPCQVGSPPTPCPCDHCKQKRRRIIVCHDEHPAAPPRGPESAPDGEQAPGAFLAPPQAGTTVEGGTTVGIRGLAIRFHEMRLALPTVELPRLQRFQDHRRMELESAVAPYHAIPQQRVMGGVARYPAPTGVEAAPEEPDRGPESAPDAMIDRCKELEQALLKKNAELQEKIRHMDALMAELAAKAGAASCPPVPSSRPMPRTAPQPVCPTPDAVTPESIPVPPKTMQWLPGPNASHQSISPHGLRPQGTALEGTAPVRHATHLRAEPAEPHRIPAPRRLPTASQPSGATLLIPTTGKP